MKRFFARLYWILSQQFGLDPRILFRSLRGLPRFLRDGWRFRRSYQGRMKLLPCLHDWYEEGGTTRSEYFWQDLLVARRIFAASPQKHVDIGSRVDGFVAHVASFRDIEVFDIRPIQTTIPGVNFRQADMMSPVPGMTDYCDSLSCLHALEHFGLGRYGDPLDPLGHRAGFANMAALLKPTGVFYLSVPVGIACVEFNGHRIFDPHEIVGMAGEHGLRLSRLTDVCQGVVSSHETPDATQLRQLAEREYSLGIFEFVRTR